MLAWFEREDSTLGGEGEELELLLKTALWLVGVSS